MQYNIHNEKYKQSDVIGIHKEQFREYKETANYRNDVDSERTIENCYIEMSENGKDWVSRIREARQNAEKETRKSIRKDAVVLCSTVESVPSSWPNEVCREYFKDKAAWYENYLVARGGVDKSSMLSVCVHLDETTPHATYAWMPLKDGKFQAKNILTKDFLKSLQSDSQKFTFDWITKYTELTNMQLEKLSPIMSGSKKQHLNEARYKKAKLEESIQNLESQHDFLENKTAEKQKEIESAEAHVNELKTKTDEIQKEYQKTYSRLDNLKMRESTIAEKERQIIDITKASDLRTYSEIRTENLHLKSEISKKDKIIESLKEKIEVWKNKFEVLAKHLGNKVLQKLGFEASAKNEYPTARSVSAFTDLRNKVKDIRPAALRVIPDYENKGQFQIVSLKKNGEFTKIEGNFSSREDASERRDEIMNLEQNFSLRQEGTLKEKL